MSDLDEFKATYFDECSELLAELEEQFIAIEEGDRAADRLNAVFRAIHSIKGGAGAFGFQNLVGFAHSFETLLDHVRDGRVDLTDDVVALCIRSNDLVADFVGAAREDRELDADHGATEKAQFEALCNPDGEDDGTAPEEFDIEFTPVLVDLDSDVGADGFDIPPMPDATPVVEDDRPGSVNDAADLLGDDLPSDEATLTEGLSDLAGSEDTAPADSHSWTIRFRPHPALFERANDPILLLRELAGLGEAVITPEVAGLPALKDFEPFGVYCGWTITVTGERATESALREVFEFVEGDCDLTIEASAAVLSASADESRAHESDDIAEARFEPEGETGPEAVADLPSFADLADAIQPAPKKAEPEQAPERPAAATKASSPASGQGEQRSAIQSIRVDLDKVDRVVNMVGELVITQSMLTQQMDDVLRDRYQELVRGLEVLAQTTRGLQDSVMAIRAQPVKSVFSRMPRLVRELSAKTGKKIRLEMVGEHTEIDKTVIEQLSDPLTHMIRNSADHGVEQPDARVAKGKSETGTIRLSAEQAGGSILIIVEDDGAGINREKVLELARERGVVPLEAQLSDEQIDNLIFAPGFSTATEVSDISGRGVGMDVVLSNIKKIGGSVQVRSTPGRGTRMTLRLPLTLAVLDVMLVKVAGCPYVIPLSSIVETIQFSKSEFGSVPSGARVLQIRGDYVQVVDLADRFDLHSDIADKDRFVVLCEGEGSARIALVVDSIIGQQQVVIKSLEENYESIEGIAGGTILGDGSVALIVDVQGIRSGRAQQKAA